MAQAEKSAELMDTAISSVPQDLADVIKNDPLARQFYGVSRPISSAH